MIQYFMTSPAEPPPTPPPPLRLLSGTLACGLAGVVSASVLLVLLTTGAVHAGAGVCGLIVVSAATLLLMRQARAADRSVSNVQPAVVVNEAKAGPALAATLQALPSPLLVVAASGATDSSDARVVFANAAAKALWQIDGDNRPLTTAIRAPEVWEVMDEALIGRIPGEASFETTGAQSRFYRAFARPMPDEDGGERLALLIVNDETDARRNERMRSDFLANASHELRTPLASLTGFIETLRGHARDDEVARAKFLEIMAVQADRMSRLVADLMSLSRIELNEHIPPRGAVDLAVAAIDVIDALAPQAAEAKVKLRPTLPPRGEAVVLGDRDQILQVIQNLVDNGIKYAGQGGFVLIDVTGGLATGQAVEPLEPDAARLSLLTPDRSQDIYARVRVQDSGPGIPRQYLPRLTERFYRVEGQKSGEKLGTGLGLAIVKHIMNRHRGGLAVESGPGSGAAFLAYFPQVPPKPE